MDKDKKLSDFPQHRENPFMPNLLIPTARRTVAIGRPKDKRVIDSMTGEMDDSLFIGIKKQLDKEEFVKIFQSQLQAIFDLSKSALKVLSYFMSVAKYSDELDFDLEDCKEFTKYSSKDTISNGITELLNSEIVARGRNPYKYYANPSVFYKGDRIVLVTEYRMTKKKGLEDKFQLGLFDEKVQSDS